MPQGLLSTYDLTVGVPVDIETLISQLAPYDVPLLNGDAGVPAIPRGTCFEKKAEWQDDSILTPRSTLNGALTTGTTSVVIATADANHFGPGDVLQIEAEKVRVTALSTDGVTLTVTRAFAGTAVNHADASKVTGVGKALPEGSDPAIARATDRSNRYNVTQIFGPEAVQVSATENTIRKYGLEGTNEFNYQVMQRLREKAIELEQAMLYGTRVDDGTNEWRTMGGMSYYFTVLDSSTTTLTDTALLNALQSVFDAGGSPTDILAGSKQKRTISGFNSSLITLDRSDATRGTTVDTFVTDFGLTRVRLDRWVLPNNLFIYDRNDLELATLRPFQLEMLAKTGDSMKGQVVGEYTFKARRAAHQFAFTALT